MPLAVAAVGSLWRATPRGLPVHANNPAIPATPFIPPARAAGLWPRGQQPGEHARMTPT